MWNSSDRDYRLAQDAQKFDNRLIRGGYRQAPRDDEIHGMVLLFLVLVGGTTSDDRPRNTQGPLIAVCIHKSYDFCSCLECQWVVDGVVGNFVIHLQMQKKSF